MSHDQENQDWQTLITVCLSVALWVRNTLVRMIKYLPHTSGVTG